MKLVVVCDECGKMYAVGHCGHLPQPMRMMTLIADAYHGHRCKVSPPVAKVC